MSKGRVRANVDSIPVGLQQAPFDTNQSTFAIGTNKALRATHTTHDIIIEIVLIADALADTDGRFISRGGGGWARHTRSCIIRISVWIVGASQTCNALARSALPHARDMKVASWRSVSMR